ncbi:two-component system response regulator YesN [Paenibacillus sp. SORGH_AS306]|uniref:response regulator n=1 Tax=unclassified Paenibacillus TaxID=185978 RepID=UPI002784A620|nr:MULTISPECIES: response regulator [unclassified Paenibacillus]MDQ1234765.1 two-component system response regulator YesN [Paenibacillus sp. SORGH_AS_0306]MDR6111812.1 two-component system response regulator YesN [Paenibacillus sp. SORGH_AS_0338]
MKVLIVDDEMTIHNQLKQCIHWEHYGWSIVGHAYNGEEACQMVEQHQPDVILTDIRMPHMDGLEFLAWLKNSSYTAKAIALSGYNDFDYSRPAFLLNVVDYLLKPLNEAELLILLSKLEEQIKQESKQQHESRNQNARLYQGIQLMQDEWLSHLLSTAQREENELIVEADQLKFPLPEYPYYIVTIKLFDLTSNMNSRYKGDLSIFYFAARNIIKENVATYYAETEVFRNLNELNEFLFFVRADISEHLFTHWLKRIHTALTAYLHITIKIGVSAKKQRITAIKKAYTESIHAIDHLTLSHTDTISFFGKDEAEVQHHKSVGEEIWKELNTLLKITIETASERSGQQFIEQLNHVFEKEAIDKMSSREIKIGIVQLLNRVEASTDHAQIMLLLVEAKFHLVELNIEKVKYIFQQIIELHVQQVSRNLRTKSGSQLIKTIKVYSQENYNTVTLENISQRFFINKNYFCTLFKNETGEGFLEFLTKIRIEKAKTLLVSTDLKTYEIAEKVGYSDARYFSQVFKKIVGTQPSLFKQHHKTENNES